MTYRPASRLAEIEPFHAVELLTRARQLEAESSDIIHMEIGEPDFPSPEPIVTAAVDAIKAGKTHYTQSLGLPELRAAIAGFFTNSGVVGLYAIIARSFPTHVRATATGFVIGVGRGGAALSPVIAGLLFQAGIATGFVALCMAAGSLLAATALLLLHRRAQATRQALS